MLEGKQIYREASEIKLSWDTPFPEEIAKQWLKWEENASDDVYFPHILVQYQEPIDNIKFLAFGEASIHGVFVRRDTGSDCRQILPRQEKSDDSSFGARVRPDNSQLDNKCAGCSRRLQYDEGYTVLDRQHCSPTLAER